MSVDMTRPARHLVHLAVALGALGVAAPTAAAGDRAAPRIVGGVPTDIASAPWQVALWNPSRGTPAAGQFCGGTVVGPRTVVTAAHCVVDAKTGAVSAPTLLRVLAGTGHLRSGGEPKYGSEVRDVAVSTVGVHGSYSAATIDYDAAVLTVGSDLFTGSATATIAPLALPSSGGRPADGALVAVSGWGDTTSQDQTHSLIPNYPVDLRGVETHVVSQRACNRAYGGQITDRMICAGEPLGGKDSCSGDSGGPLSATIAGTRVLSGIVSFGIGCGLAEWAGVYANTADPTINTWLRAQIPAAAAPGGEPPVEGTTTETAPAPAPAPIPAPVPDTSTTTVPAPTNSAVAPVAVVAPSLTSGAVVPAAPPRTDEARPTVRIVGRRCTSARCTVRFTVQDPAPSSGIAGVSATIRWAARIRCVRAGRTTTCARPRTRMVRPALVGGRTWSVSTGRLAAGRTGLRVVARDRAGHRSAAARATLPRGRS